MTTDNPAFARARQTGHVLATVTWVSRLFALTLMAVLTFVLTPTSGSDLVIEVIVFAVCSGVVLIWALVDTRNLDLDRCWLAAGLGTMAVSGVLCTGPNGGAFLGFCVFAVLAAASAISWTPGWITVTAAVLSIEVGALIFSVDTARVWAYPLVLALTFIAGRNYRAYAIAAQQAQTLLAQSEQLREQQRQVATLDERSRIAREIHDVLAHSLGALGIHLQVIRAVLDEGDEDQARTMLSQAQRMASDGLVDTRRAVQALRGDTTRLDEQLATLIQTHRIRHRTTIELLIDGQPGTMAAEATVALVRTAQEALVNTAKHAAHQPVEVDLRYREDLVSVAISNALPDAAPDGQANGDEPAFRSVNGGYGLISMRERLLLIKGTLTAGTDEHRWTVHAQVPR
ncbi:MAG: histidine kinase [Mycobacteriaceae bacterium]